MYMNKCFTGAFLGVLLCSTGIAFGQQSQSTNGMPSIADQARVHPDPSRFPLGHKMTEADFAEAANEQKIVQARIYSLDRDATQALFLGQYSVAEANARLSKSLGQDSSIADEVLAQALDGQGKNQDALQQYKSLLAGSDNPKLTPTQVANTYSRDLIPYAQLLLKTGQWAQAVDAYNKAMPPLTKKDVENYKKGSYSYDYMLRASSHFSVDTQQPEELATALHIARGLGYERSDWAGNMQDEKAMDQFNQAVQLSPNSDLANYYHDYGIREAARHKLQASSVKQTGAATAK